MEIQEAWRDVEDEDFLEHCGPFIVPVAYLAGSWATGGSAPTRPGAAWWRPSGQPADRVRARAVRWAAGQFLLGLVILYLILDGETFARIAGGFL